MFNKKEIFTILLLNNAFILLWLSDYYTVLNYLYNILLSIQNKLLGTLMHEKIHEIYQEK